MSRDRFSFVSNEKSRGTPSNKNPRGSHLRPNLQQVGSLKIPTAQKVYLYETVVTLVLSGYVP